MCYDISQHWSSATAGRADTAAVVATGGLLLGLFLDET